MCKDNSRSKHQHSMFELGLCNLYSTDKNVCATDKHKHEEKHTSKRLSEDHHVQWTKDPVVHQTSIHEPNESFGTPKSILKHRHNYIVFICDV